MLIEKERKNELAPYVKAVETIDMEINIDIGFVDGNKYKDDIGKSMYIYLLKLGANPTASESKVDDTKIDYSKKDPYFFFNPDWTHLNVEEEQKRIEYRIQESSLYENDDENISEGFGTKWRKLTPFEKKVYTYKYCLKIKQLDKIKRANESRQNKRGIELISI